MTLVIKAQTKDFYEREILRLDEKQIRMHDTKIKDNAIDGIILDPRDFPEAVRFVIVYRPNGAE